MRTVDGYEELPGGTEYVAPQPPQQPSSTTSQPPVAGGHQQQGPAAADVHGLHASGLDAAAAGPQQRQQQPAPIPHYLANIPSIVDEWREATRLMGAWLACSITTLFVSLFSFNNLAVVAAICGIVGASMHRCRCCQGTKDMAASVRVMYGMAITAASLGGVIGALSLMLAFGLSATCDAADDPRSCAELTEITLLYGLWYSLFATVSGVAVKRAAGMRRVLNPVSSGAATV